MKRTLSLALCGVCVIAGGARADIFVLQSGGQVRGELLNPDETPRKTFKIKTSAGGELLLTEEQVKQVMPQSAAEMEYDRIHSNYPDTVEGQWKLAEWCRANKLSKLRAPHLERVIELDPEHKEARAALGYTKIQGRWETPDKKMIESGYVRYKGAWRLQQEVEVLEAKRKDEVAQKAWVGKVKRWRTALDRGDKAEQARAYFASVTDPYATKALSDLLAREKDRDVKLLLIDSLAQIGGGALDALVTRSIDDADDEIRIACLEKITSQNYRPAVGRFIQGLKSKDNLVVNRSAVGLSHMKDPSAVGPLIDALVTTHSFKIVKGQPGQMSSTFGNNPGGGGFSFGGGGTEIVKRKLQNKDVLDSLVSLTTPVNFDFDRHAWKYWFAGQNKPKTPGTRRD